MQPLRLLSRKQHNASCSYDLDGGGIAILWVRRPSHGGKALTQGHTYSNECLNGLNLLLKKIGEICPLCLTTF